jgi:hypothetical protein
MYVFFISSGSHVHNSHSSAPAYSPNSYSNWQYQPQYQSVDEQRVYSNRQDTLPQQTSSTDGSNNINRSIPISRQMNDVYTAVPSMTLPYPMNNLAPNPCTPNRSIENLADQQSIPSFESNLSPTKAASNATYNYHR